MVGCAVGTVAILTLGRSNLRPSTPPLHPKKLCCSLLSLQQLEREGNLEKTKGQAGGFSGCFLRQSLYRLAEVTSEGDLSGEGCLSH